MKYGWGVMSAGMLHFKTNQTQCWAVFVVMHTDREVNHLCNWIKQCRLWQFHLEWHSEKITQLQSDECYECVCIFLNHRTDQVWEWGGARCDFSWVGGTKEKKYFRVGLLSTNIAYYFQSDIHYKMLFQNKEILYIFGSIKQMNKNRFESYSVAEVHSYGKMSDPLSGVLYLE